MCREKWKKLKYEHENEKSIEEIADILYASTIKERIKEKQTHLNFST